MIYISSACVKAKTIKEAIKILYDEGYKNIELSGGTKPYDQLEADLIGLKNYHNLNFLCHNYFPPPENPFVLNLAATNNEISELSKNHCKKAIDLSIKLGAKKYGFHAGFLINIPLNQIGKGIEKQSLYNESEAYLVFQRNLTELMGYAGDRIELYIENNVLSLENYLNFNKVDPFFFTSSLNHSKIKYEIPFILDLAHLKVSCNTLNLDFEKEVEYFLPQTDYIHISDNNGKADQNLSLDKESDLYRILQKNSLKGKTITLETYDGLEKLKETFNLINELIKN